MNLKTTWVPCYKYKYFKKILEIMENYSLVDAFRSLYPNLHRYTWRKPNSDKMACLDYFIVSNYLMDIIPEIKIRYGHRSDHSIIELKIHLNKFKRGPGTWKFNSSLLKNKLYVELINKTIEQIVENISSPSTIHLISTKSLPMK